ncbi:signal recognition particle-docking protein FtsY [Synechococcus sp. PROS-7-1]|uniref:signal recognition particle-docking protein FtsY n=1 Tax=Synechococcus sp. PROS-7-1 TaxID=1442556 RepID=UPI001648D9D5|nr:signal recognition particle-docking protein FtsY [Synechococcus sp. PROS-7-1]QNI83852.1 signal recognition particle-docking protein FtsY [Synechococcus sp. PROS-7-1]
MVYDWFNRQSETAPTQPPADPEASSPESQQETAVNADDDPLEWARQAYARLKAQKEQANAIAAEPVPESIPEAESESQPESAAEPEPAAAEQAPVAGLSLLEQAAAQRQERQQQLEQEPEVADQPIADATVEVDRDEEPTLGDFDDTFTWSAEVLAAQGRQAGQVTLEEIDWLSRLRQGLEKTRQGFVTGLLENLGDDPLTPEVLDDLESLLLRADAGVKATDQVLDALRKRMNEQVVDPSEGIRFLKEQLRDLLEAPIKSSGVDLLAPQRGQLNVWLMVGVNGVGKTTTLGKLANLAVRSGYSAMIAAADTFRAAAVQQVQVWGDRSDVPVVANPSANADPAAVVFDAIGAARSKGTDLVLVDTAGRLQTKHNLMEELNKIRRVVDRLAPDATVESLLVLDASQGQNGLKQAMAFARAAGLTGVVITKLDGTARGGVALAVASEAGLPIRFIGAGEGIRDLRPFNSFEFVEALLAGR